MADFSTRGDECTPEIPLLEGQTRIDELLLETDGMFVLIRPEWALPASDANGSNGHQLRLF